MLVLTRTNRETVTLDGPNGERVAVTLDRAHSGRARLLIEAPPQWQISRNELLPEDQRYQLPRKKTA